MISDVLSNAVISIDDYLNNSFYDSWYSGALRNDIIVLRNQMDLMRAEIDMPPPSEQNTPEHIKGLIEHWTKLLNNGILKTIILNKVMLHIGALKQLSPNTKDLDKQIETIRKFRDEYLLK